MPLQLDTKINFSRTTTLLLKAKDKFTLIMASKRYGTRRTADIKQYKYKLSLLIVSFVPQPQNSQCFFPFFVFVVRNKQTF